MDLDQADALASSGYAPPDVDRRLAARSPSFRRWMEDHLRLAASVASLGVVLGALVASFGFKVAGPGARVDALAARSSVTDSVLAQHARRLDRLESRDEFATYLLCVLIRRSDPTALPPECGPVIQSRGAP